MTKHEPRYLLIWCDGVPKDENGDVEIDRAHMIYEEFASLEAAATAAKAILSGGRDFFGAVEIVKQTPHGNGTRLWDDVAFLYLDDEARAYTEQDLQSLDGND